MVVTAAGRPDPGDGFDDVVALERLDEAAIKEIAGLYGPTEPELVSQLAAASGGIPAQIHTLAGAWASEGLTQQVGTVSERTATQRAETRELETTLADILVELQSLRDRADSFGTAPEREPLAVCPYKGLAAFEFDDAGYFFGRERVVAELVAQLVGSPLLAIVGASGSGKSSLLRAGLLPALARPALPGSDKWSRRLIRPGENPLRELRSATVSAGRGRSVIAIDQFEEIFTLCRDSDERRAFLDELVRLSRDPAGRFVVVLTLRADLYGRCATHAEFAGLLNRHTVLVGPLRREELRSAITRPADRAGLRVEPELVDALLSDVESQPGALPLLSAALLELWRHRDGDTLRLRSWEHAGGLSGSIARWAEAAFATLSLEEQRDARRVFLRLADGEGSTAVARRFPLGELEGERAGGVVDRLAAARLLTIADDTVEVAHEALLREWPRLSGWLEEDAQGRRIHRHLSVAARDWIERGREPSDLYRGARLAAAQEWRAGHETDLNALERTYLDAGVAEQDDELETAKRRTRRLRALAGGLAALAVVAVASVIIATGQARRANDETRTAISRSFATQAVSLLATDPDVAALLSVEAYRTAPTIEARSAARPRSRSSNEPLGACRPTPRRRPTWPSRPTSRTLAVAHQSAGVRLWDLRTRRPLGPPLDDRDGSAARVAFSPDGSTLVVAGVGGLTRWDVAQRRKSGQTGFDRESARKTMALTQFTSGRIAFAPDGGAIMVETGPALTEPALGIWDMGDAGWAAGSGGDATALNLGAHSGRPTISGDGGLVAVANEGGSIRRFDTRSARWLDPIDVRLPTVAVALDRDGTTLAGSRQDRGRDGVGPLGAPPSQGLRVRRKPR